MNADWAPGGRQPSDQTNRFGLWARRKIGCYHPQTPSMQQWWNHCCIDSSVFNTLTLNVLLNTFNNKRIIWSIVEKFLSTSVAHNCFDSGSRSRRSQAGWVGLSCQCVSHGFVPFCPVLILTNRCHGVPDIWRRFAALNFTHILRDGAVLGRRTIRSQGCMQCLGNGRWVHSRNSLL